MWLQKQKIKHPPRLAAEALSFSRVRWASQGGQTEGGEVSMQSRGFWVLDVFSLYTFTCVILQYVATWVITRVDYIIVSREHLRIAVCLLRYFYIVHGGSSSPRLFM